MHQCSYGSKDPVIIALTDLASLKPHIFNIIDCLTLIQIVEETIAKKKMFLDYN